MTTMTLANQAITAPGRSLEELVDGVMDALLGEPEGRQAQSAARSIHDARRLSRAGDPDGALAVLGGVDVAAATERDARWAYAEWNSVARRRFGGSGALVYSQGTGRAAVLLPGSEGRLRVAAAIGMRWRPGKVVSRRSLRGLRPLAGGGR